MIRVIADTNVIVSALLKTESDPALIVSLVLGRHIGLCLSDEIYREYREVLARDKFKQLDQESVKRFLQEIKLCAAWVKPKISLNAIKSDPDDNKFLECALAAEADFLITGNTKHFPFRKFESFLIVSPREFIDLVASALVQ